MCHVTITMTVKSAVFRPRQLTPVGPPSFCCLFIALSIVRCLKSAQKFAVQLCQVTAVVMETMQLVLSRFRNFSSCPLRIELALCLPQMNGEVVSLIVERRPV